MVKYSDLAVTFAKFVAKSPLRLVLHATCMGAKNAFSCLSIALELLLVVPNSCVWPPLPKWGPLGPTKGHQSPMPGLRPLGPCPQLWARAFWVHANIVGRYKLYHKQELYYKIYYITINYSISPEPWSFLDFFQF